MRFRYFLTAILAILFSSCSSAIFDDDDDAVEYVGIGDTVPDFCVMLSDGTAFSPTSMKGVRWLLVFFSIDCQDCHRLLPEIEEYHLRHTDLPIICIARDNAQSAVAEYWEENGLTLIYAAPGDRAVYNQFATSIVPRLYVIDEHGTVVQKFTEP